MLEHYEEFRYYRFCRRITANEVKEVIRKIRRGITVGSDEIPVEVWRCLGEEGIEWFTRFNVFLKIRIPVFQINEELAL